MTGLRLLLKSRRSLLLAALLVTVAVITRLAGGQRFLIGEQEPVPLPWAAVLPTVSAYAVAATAMSSMPLVEHQAARRIAGIQAAYLLAAAVIGAAFVAWGAAPLTGDVAVVGALRNYLGLLGLSLLGCAVLDAGLGWALPLSCLGTGVVAGGARVHTVLLDWLIRPGGDPPAAWFASALLLAGAGLFLSPRLRRRQAVTAGRVAEGP
ncbi:MAG TPA: hypothetical protein VGP31_19485 [Planosporangium sp.]|nr:hypothetical protein [Planosporangium sp.]